MNFLKRESKKIKDGKVELKRRRLNWKVFVQPKIAKHFNYIVMQTRSADYPFNLNCSEHDETENEATVQLSAATNKTGVMERINTPESKGTKCEAEQGSALVVSFSSVGEVAVILYPYKSDRHSVKEDNIILYHGLSPDRINERFLNKCISKYFLYLRYSSVHGAHSLSVLDRTKVIWMIIVDIRNRRKLLSSFYSIFTEWFKIISAGIVGYIVAILTQGGI